MKLITLLIKETVYRKGMFIMSFLLIAAAMSSLVATRSISDASQEEVRKFMLQMGTNITILPDEVNLSNYWRGEFGDVFMPEDYVNQIAVSTLVNARHFIAKLQGWITIEEKPFILTGIHPELGAPGKNKKELISPVIEKGEAILGYETANVLKIKAGDTVQILDEKFVVRNINLPSGTVDDQRVYIDLREAQRLLDKPGLINAIDAVGCLCYGDFISAIKEQIEKVLPDTRVLVYRSIATARAKTRVFIEKIGLYLQLFLFSIAGVIITFFSISGVWERREEIAVLQAVGVSIEKIVFIFGLKLFIMAVIGGVLGFLGGSLIGAYWGRIFLEARVIIKISFLGVSLLFSFLIVMIAGITSVIRVAGIKPAEILRVK